jgi:hypothetical protein
MDDNENPTWNVHRPPTPPGSHGITRLRLSRCYKRQRRGLHRSAQLLHASLIRTQPYSLCVSTNCSYVHEIFNVLHSRIDRLCQSSWLQIQRSRLDSRRYQIFWEVVGLEQGPLSLVSIIELFGRKSSGSGLEIREYGRRGLSRWPRGTIYPQIQ